MSYRKPLHYRSCPHCGKIIGLKRDGTLYKHGKRFGCPGSATPPGPPSPPRPLSHRPVG